MALWTYWSGEPLPSLRPLQDFSVDSALHTHELVALTDLERQEVEARLGGGNRCYVARIGETPVAYGWAASAAASIGELTLDFGMGAWDRYLWDFKTLPQWRGLGVYPRLLQAIIEDQARDATRFWIINAPENLASAKGIEKAGFRVVGDLAFAEDGHAALAAADPDAAQIGARLLGVGVIDKTQGGVSPCWCCIMDALRQGTAAACWPSGSLAAPACSCGTPNEVPA